MEHHRQLILQIKGPVSCNFNQSTMVIYFSLECARKTFLDQLAYAIVEKKVIGNIVGNESQRVTYWFSKSYYQNCSSF